MNMLMTYLINKEITFRSDDGVMTSIASPENTVTLSITASRIFTYLLEENGKIVSRDNIFINVWDNNGLQASNNSLSQYISLIRRSLHDLGCVQEVIQTIPRVGFLIPEGLVSVCEKKASQSLQHKRPAPLPEVTGLTKATKLIVAGALAISLALMIFPISNLKGHAPSLTTATTWKLGNIDKCPIYTFNKHSSEMSSVVLEQAQKLANAYLACVEGATYYFQPDDLYVFNGSGRAFLSRCTWRSKDQTTFAGCKDVYIHEH
jgi:DNA-binding winged-HTH domains